MEKSQEEFLETLFSRNYIVDVWLIFLLITLRICIGILEKHLEQSQQEFLVKFHQAFMEELPEDFSKYFSMDSSKSST